MGGRHGLLGSELLQLWFHSILKFLSKWLIYFPLMYALCVCGYVRSANSERPSVPLSPNPQPCNAVQQAGEPQSRAELWKRQRHKSHLGLLQRKLLFCNKLPDGNKKRFLPVYLMGDWSLCFYLAICSGLCPFKLVRSITSFKLLPWHIAMLWT